MSFKEQLSKHEQLINKYKELYMNENSKSNNFDKNKNKPISSQSISLNNISNYTNNNISNNTTTKNFSIN